jgi:hypothetical protein
VPKPGPRTISRHPTPTKLPIENGPEIIAEATVFQTAAFAEFGGKNGPNSQ